LNKPEIQQLIDVNIGLCNECSIEKKRLASIFGFLSTGPSVVAGPHFSWCSTLTGATRHSSGRTTRDHGADHQSANPTVPPRVAVSKRERRRRAYSPQREAPQQSSLYGQVGGRLRPDGSDALAVPRSCF